MKSFCLKISLLLIGCLLTLSGYAQEKPVHFYEIKLHQEINAAAARIVSKGLTKAEAKQVDYVILNLNTYGGAVDAADSIRSRILACEIPVIAFINNQAVSAGSLISIACDSIYIKDGSTFGAASVVNQTGDLMPDKYQAFMKSMMRATAEANGRDPKIAERMVMSDSTGKVLSLTMSEAMAVGYCEGNAETIEEVVKAVDPGAFERGDYQVDPYTMTFMERMILFLMSPVLQAIFMMMIIWGIYSEIQSPGIGLALAVAILGALLYFAPLYIEGLAQHWEILLFAVGIILILLEIFVIPGFGIAGISGIVAIVASLTFAMIDNEIFRADRLWEFRPAMVLKPFAFVVITVFVSVVLSIAIAPRLFKKGGLFGRVALNTELDSKAGYVSTNLSALNSLIGSEVIAATDMRPAGKVLSGESWYDASVKNGMAAKGDRLKVLLVENGRLYCEKVD